MTEAVTEAEAELLKRACGTVSRETSERLAHFTAEVVRWNRAVNLVSRMDLGRIWPRHIIDSAQLWPLGARLGGSWLDVGSGGGFPGLVVAILAADTGAPSKVDLVEGDGRKAAFLQAMIRDLALPARVHAERIEALPAFHAHVVSARAFAPLARLLELAVRHRCSDGIALFPKGRGHQKELDEALRRWDFEYRLHPSASASEAVILEIGTINGAR